MPASLTAVVTVTGPPARLDEEHATPTAIFPINESQRPVVDDVHAASELLEGEVLCRGDLAVAVLRKVREGDQLLLAGTLTTRPALVASIDAPSVLVTIEARDIGLHLNPV